MKVSARSRARWELILPVLFVSLAMTLKAENPTPVAQTVVFKSGNVFLHGYLFKPDGPGPFPAVVWEHGSPKPLLESGPASRFDALARFYTTNGYVLFVPDRSYKNIYFRSGVARFGPAKQAVDDESAFRQGLEQLEQNHLDSVNALEWLKAQGCVDENRIVMSGLSLGSVQILYDAKKHLGVRAYIPFSLPSSSWGSSEQLQNLMVESVREADAPIFLIQAQNDTDLRASEVLSREFIKKGSLNSAKIYPPYGKTQKEANLFILTGCGVWGEDVLTFIDAALKL